MEILTSILEVCARFLGRAWISETKCFGGVSKVCFEAFWRYVFWNVLIMGLELSLWTTED